MANIELSNHAKYRFLERGIDVHEAKRISKNGKITKSEPGGTITKEGICVNGKKLIIKMTEKKGKIVIITAYYEN